MCTIINPASNTQVADTSRTNVHVKTRLPVLIVIPTLNEAANIERVLAQLEVRNADLPDSIGLDLLTVITDGGSADRTRDIVASLMLDRADLRLVNNPQRAQSAGINLAIATFGSPGGVAIRCDAHCEYPPGFIRDLVVALKRTGADSVVVPMDSVGTTCFGKAVAWVSDTRVGSGGSAHRGGRKSGWIDHGHHAAFLVDSYRANGGYDESFTHNEDAEYDCRLRKRGGSVFLDATNRVIYHPRSTVAGLWRQYRGYGRGRSRTVRRHPDSLRARQLLLPTAILGAAACLLLSIAVPLLALVPAVYVLVLAATSLAIAAKRRALSGLLTGIAAVVMHVSWTLGFVEGFLTVRQARWTTESETQIRRAR